MARKRAPQPSPEPQPDAGAEPNPVVGRMASAINGAVDAVGGAADKVSGAVGRVSGAVGKVGGAIDRVEEAVEAAVGATGRRWDERPGARVRRIRRRSREPLPMLYEAHPEARNAVRRDLGLRTIDVNDIAGTAVGGPQQRGGDFLPLKPFRSGNWQTRWQRLRSAADRLTVLPPIDVVRYGDRYWVLDGHNRIASALYDGQLAIDAMVTELAKPGTASERPASLAELAEDSMDLRRAVGRQVLDRRRVERRQDERPANEWDGRERRQGDRRLIDRGWASEDEDRGPR